jgi:hypothetical protein
MVRLMIDALQVRLRELAEVVDRFVILGARHNLCRPTQEAEFRFT